MQAVQKTNKIYLVKWLIENLFLYFDQILKNMIILNFAFYYLSDSFCQYFNHYFNLTFKGLCYAYIGLIVINLISNCFLNLYKQTSIQEKQINYQGQQFTIGYLFSFVRNNKGQKLINMTENNTFGGTAMNKALKDDGDDFLNTALRKWKFNSKYKRNRLLFILLTMFFLLFGSLFTYYYTQIVQVTVRYDNQCKLNTICTFDINIPQHMSSPIFFYYQLDNFFQTHRKFYQSKDIQQLRGQDRSASDLVSCAPFITNADMGKTVSIGGFPLNPTDPAIPCGLIAKTFFNDTFKMYQQDSSNIPINDSDIAWDVDMEYNYKPTNNAQKLAWHDVTDEHFMVWMRTSGMGKFKKLWGRINQDLPSGDYQIVVNNQYNSSDFNGYKYVLLTTSSPFGQKNLVLIIAYFSGAFVCIVSYIILVTLNKNKKDK
ncbi:hypothetical protein ABPG74_004500 [Tetrahymena malaccensis]